MTATAAPISLVLFIVACVFVVYGYSKRDAYLMGIAAFIAWAVRGWPL